MSEQQDTTGDGVRFEHDHSEETQRAGMLRTVVHFKVHSFLIVPEPVVAAEPLTAGEPIAIDQHGRATRQ